MTTAAQIFRAGTPELIGTDIDLRIAEVHTAEAIVTTQVIEDGTVVSDHIVLQPDTVEIVAEVSNVDQQDDRLFSVGGIASQFGVQLEAGSQGERARTAWTEFKRQIRSRQLFDVLTDHEIYTNMALELLSGEHFAPWRGRISLRLGFIRVDTTQLTFVRVGEDILDAANTDGQVVDPVSKAAGSQVDEGFGVTIRALQRPNLIAITEAAIVSYLVRRRAEN